MDKPRIRFKGYTDAWEQRKLGDICESFEYGLNAAAKEYDGKNKYIRITDIDDSSHEFLQEDVTSPDMDLTGAENYCLKYGDILFTRTGASVGKTYIYKDSDGLVYYAGFLIRGRVKDEFAPEFVFQNTLTDDYEKFIRITSQRSGQPGVNAQEYAGYEISMPTYKEQKKIGQYFSNLDHLITLHQRKCDETKKLKKYMLQNMFPRNGSNVPAIRFDGFTNAWEQRKLGEVFEQTAIFVNPNDEEIELWSLTVEDGLTPKSERYNREFLVKKDTNFKEVRPGDIVYNPMNMTLGAVGYNGMAKSVAVSGYYTTMIANEGYDSYYINTWLKSPQAVSLYKTFATGSLKEKQRVQFPTLSIIPVTFPTYEEQEKIGAYFAHLDHLITLHQHKCDELVKIKKYMLQNMFV